MSCPPDPARPPRVRPGSRRGRRVVVVAPRPPGRHRHRRRRRRGGGGRPGPRARGPGLHGPRGGRGGPRLPSARPRRSPRPAPRPAPAGRRPPRLRFCGGARRSSTRTPLWRARRSKPRKHTVRKECEDFAGEQAAPARTHHLLSPRRDPLALPQAHQVGRQKRRSMGDTGLPRLGVSRRGARGGREGSVHPASKIENSGFLKGPGIRPRGPESAPGARDPPRCPSSASQGQGTRLECGDSKISAPGFPAGWGGAQGPPGAFPTRHGMACDRPHPLRRLPSSAGGRPEGREEAAGPEV